jgi:tripartite-type tricarboxylate transporter receptor subunit TctC
MSTLVQQTDHTPAELDKLASEALREALQEPDNVARLALRIQALFYEEEAAAKRFAARTGGLR